MPASILFVALGKQVGPLNAWWFSDEKRSWTGKKTKELAFLETRRVASDETTQGEGFERLLKCVVYSDVDA
jgi:hypothetical protein